MQQNYIGERIQQAWDKAWNNGDVEALDDVLASDYQRTGLLDNKIYDKAGMKNVILNVRESFPDMHTSISQCVEDNDSIAILWTSTATHLGAYRGVPPTKKSIVTSGASFFSKQDDMIIRETETWDARDILSTLGIFSLGSSQESDDI